ncbi:hypothetical protein C8R44DRAFT_740441 [Mycena epipterygia]|nr:hypothetical protein C8R44DRAFT_740441 [Mycena epipterygia]
MGSIHRTTRRARAPREAGEALVDGREKEGIETMQSSRTMTVERDSVFGSGSASVTRNGVWKKLALGLATGAKCSRTAMQPRVNVSGGMGMRAGTAPTEVQFQRNVPSGNDAATYTGIGRGTKWSICLIQKLPTLIPQTRVPVGGLCRAFDNNERCCIFRP